MPKSGLTKTYIFCLLGVAVHWGAMAWAEPFVAVCEGQAVCDIVVDTRGSGISAPAFQKEQAEMKIKGRFYYFALQPFARWLAEELEKSTGASLPILVDEQPSRAAIVISLAENYREIAEEAGFDFAAREQNPFPNYDGFCIVSTPDRLYILGQTELACRQAVALLLNRLGFRYFNSSPRWWIVPEQWTLAIDLNLIHIPTFFDVAVPTKRGYDINTGACGSGVIMWERGHRFAYANHGTGTHHFSNTHRVFVGPCTGRIVRDNKAAFDEHPEYFALLANGQRNNPDNVYRASLCLSNPGLIQLVTEDRVRKLREMRAVDRFSAMVTIEQTSGDECQCADCSPGPYVDVLFRFVNAVARGMRAKIADGFLGIRAIEPPSFPIEPNVYIGTRSTAVGAWRDKATLLGAGGDGSFRNGILVGKTRLFPGTPVAEHVAPYDSARKTLKHYQNLNVVATELGHQSFFGCQTPQLYIGLQMIWNPDVNVNALLDEFYILCFRKAAPVMRELLEAGYKTARPPIPSSSILAWGQLLDQAYGLEENSGVRGRIVDLMGYLHYLILLHEFDEVRVREGTHNEAYYAALLPMMTYVASSERYRMMFNAGSLAYDFCKKDAAADGRMDFHYHRLALEGKDPVWMDAKFPMRAGYEFRHMGDPEVLASYNDAKVIATFQTDMAKLNQQVNQGKGNTYLNVKITKGSATRAQKQSLVHDITTSLVTHLGKQPEHIHIVIDEIDPENWGFSGVLTTEYQQKSNEKKSKLPLTTDFVISRLLKSAPKKNETLHHFLSTMYQFDGEVTAGNIDELVARLQKEK
jgi:4-oxalocrotonate tautomerase